MLEGAGRFAENRALLLGGLVQVGRVAERRARRHGAGVGGAAVVDGAEVGRVHAGSCLWRVWVKARELGGNAWL